MSIVTLTSKVNRIHPFNIVNRYAKFDGDAHNGSVSIVFTRLLLWMSILTLTFHLQYQIGFTGWPQILRNKIPWNFPDFPWLKYVFPDQICTKSVSNLKPKCWFSKGKDRIFSVLYYFCKLTVHDIVYSIIWGGSYANWISFFNVYIEVSKRTVLEVGFWLSSPRKYFVIFIRNGAVLGN